MDEATVTQHVIYAAAQRNINLMRNNVGAGTIVDETTGKSSHIRWGLMNESAKQNKEIKSSDYIGMTPVWAYIDGIGWGWVGVFTAIEMKHSKWRFVQTDKHSVAQSRFHDIVRGYGGFAGFATGPDDIARICRK